MPKKSDVIAMTRLKEAGPTELSKDEEIYGSIYQAIVEHHLSPGTKLPEDALAEVFEVSRTSIRKALLRLSHEDLVTLAPNRGATVACPTAQEAREVFAARRLVETTALEMIVRQANDESIGRLREIVRREQAAQQDKDHRAAIRLSGDFHTALMRVSGNQPLTGFVRTLVSRSSLIIAVYGSPVGSRCSCSDHMELVDLIANGDAAAARDWMDRHLREIEGTLHFGAEQEEEPDLKRIFAAMRAPSRH